MVNELQAEILEKLYSYCAYQERCKQDVIKKMKRLDVPVHIQKEYINHLEQEKFLNEQRYTRLFVKSKLQNNQWGKRKLRFALQQKQIPTSIIDLSIAEITEDVYLSIAEKVAFKKLNSLSSNEPWKQKQKVYAYLTQKGFEGEIISTILEKFDKQK